MTIANSELSSWAEYGLNGLVVFALFGILAVLGRWFINHIDIQTRLHREDRQQWRKEHLEERREWLEEQKAINIILADLREGFAMLVQKLEP